MQTQSSRDSIPTPSKTSSPYPPMSRLPTSTTPPSPPSPSRPILTSSPSSEKPASTLASSTTARPSVLSTSSTSAGSIRATTFPSFLLPPPSQPTTTSFPRTPSTSSQISTFPSTNSAQLQPQVSLRRSRLLSSSSNMSPHHLPSRPSSPCSRLPRPSLLPPLDPNHVARPRTPLRPYPRQQLGRRQGGRPLRRDTGRALLPTNCWEWTLRLRAALTSLLRL
jgi:hypothetical protein